MNRLIFIEFFALAWVFGINIYAGKIGEFIRYTLGNCSGPDESNFLDLCIAVLLVLVGVFFTVCLGYYFMHCIRSVKVGAIWRIPANIIYFIFIVGCMLSIVSGHTSYESNVC